MNAGEEASESTPEESAATGQPGRGRIAFAVGAALVLAALVGVVVATGSSGDNEVTNECIMAWNEDPIASASPDIGGVHAYEAPPIGHGYREALATRVDADGNVLETTGGEAPMDEPDARCAVVFAAPELDFEPGFGVFVFDEGRWGSLTNVDGLPLDQIEAMQADAITTANATLLADGTLTQN